MDTRERRTHLDRITRNPAILAGKPVIRGTRIAVEHVLEQLADSTDLTELFEVYPDLTPEDVSAVLDYAAALAAGKPVNPAPGRRRPRAALHHDA